jgi:hypothetical protein
MRKNYLHREIFFLIMFRRDLMKRLNSYYNNKFKVAKLFIIKSSSMIPMRTGQTAGGAPA